MVQAVFMIVKFTQKLEVMAAKTKVIYWLASKYYKDIVQKEIALANITSNDNVLFVGGGICPLTAILLHQETGAKITVIDNDSHCIPKAQATVNCLGLADFIRVIHQDGGNADFSLTEYSIIHFAMQVTPMWHVFSQIERRVVSGTKLLVRRPKKGVCKLYSHLFFHSCKNCRSATHKKTCNVGSTLLYVKEAEVTA